MITAHRTRKPQKAQAGGPHVTNIPAQVQHPPQHLPASEIRVPYQSSAPSGQEVVQCRGFWTWLREKLCCGDGDIEIGEPARVDGPCAVAALERLGWYAVGDADRLRIQTAAFGELGREVNNAAALMALGRAMILFFYPNSDVPFHVMYTDGEQCRRKWQTILEREQASDGVQLAPSFLRLQFQLEERDFLLAMAALALEMDGGLRNTFRRKYALALPTIEYGLQLISPLCPSSCETLAELAGNTMLCGLLLTTAELTAYPLERPLILCRTVLAFLTGLSAAEIPGCTPMMADETQWLPLHERELEQVESWYALGQENTLYLCAPAGSGRKTLLRRACGHVVWVKLDELSPLSPLDQDHALREMVALATLLDAPICAAPDPDRGLFRQLERLCRQYGIPLAALAEEDRELEGAKEVVRLPRQLSAQQRQAVWNALLPQAEPDTAPKGAMTIGAVLETALLALRIAAVNERQAVTMEDTRQAMLRRGGALEFGVRYQTDVTLEDMVLSDHVREQLELICQAALCGDKLAAWGLPRQREGVTAVFHGPSGTGKTMAASAIAHRLGMPLLRADLSQIMDKYVGETEKHLGRLFRSARENHCVLLFDEADSLFGKRAQVTSGHDKYANLSTSYLLQEIEQYAFSH